MLELFSMKEQGVLRTIRREKLKDGSHWKKEFKKLTKWRTLILLFFITVKAATSESEIQFPSDSDRESDYMTGLEDFIESVGHPEKQRSPVEFTSRLQDPSQTSSFVQKILYEDSLAGVAVVDLFVALKAVKDNLDSLARSNSGISARLSLLNKEAIFYKQEYKELLGSMHRFLRKMEADADVWDSVAPDLELQSNTSLTSKPGEEVGKGKEEEGERTKMGSCHAKESKECEICRKKEPENSSNEENKSGCLGCFISTLKKKSLSRLPVLSEALVGSFIASLLWLQKGQKAVLDEGKDRLSLKPSTMQMIYDICEVMKEKTEHGLDGSSKASLTSVPNNSVVENLSCLYSSQPPFPDEKEDGNVVAEDTGSESESVFEEALSGPVAASTLLDLRAKPSVTCMGDLTKEASGRRNESTLTSTINVVPSWIRNLSAEISSELKKTKSKTNVKVFQQPYEVSRGKIPDSLKFSLSTNTPMGVFDVTVVQYKKRRFVSDNLLNLPTVSLADSDPKSSDDRKFTSAPGLFKLTDDDFFWSEESLFTDSDSIDTGSFSGECVLEEFIEVYVDNSKKDDSSEKSLYDHLTKGPLQLIEIKHLNADLLEIQKCQPMHFVLNIITKTSLPRETKKIEPEERALVALTSGEKRKQLVIEGSSSDIVIYIQVEVEDAQNSSSEGLVLGYQTISLGTQTEVNQCEVAYEGRIIKLEPNRQEGESLYHVWKGYEQNQQREESADWIDEEERVVMVKEPREKTITFSEEISEILIEDTRIESKSIVEWKFVKEHAFVWHVQNHRLPVDRAEIRLERDNMEDIVGTINTIETNAIELEKAMNLIREIENDVVEVKLDDAIAMLPQLEIELRKHLRDKIKVLGEKESNEDSSLHNFFSAVEFWPEDMSAGDSSSESSEVRLTNLLRMLSSLEEAVKSNEGSTSELCRYNSSKIYKLLHALTVSIRELEEGPNMTSLSQTLEIASQLDTAVRECELEVKQKPAECVKGKTEEPEEIPANHHLKNVRRKVFEIVEDEAEEVEERIERDFDRLDRLERENNEALTFLETFLQKTERRVAELGDLKVRLKDLSLSLANMYENLQELVTQEKEREKKASQLGIQLNKSRVAESPKTKEPVKETVSGLMLALDTLKSRAKEKHQLCKEILHSEVSEKELDSGTSSSRRSSRSSFTTKNTEPLTAVIRDFRKIGETSLYLSWTRPEGPLEDVIVGYQIYVNDKLNQKVRNPQRLQAILYSVDLSQKTKIQLYALTEQSPKILLGTRNFNDG